MVQVRLAQEWKDRKGAAYAAGDMVNVDAVTLAELEAKGIVAATEPPPADEPQAVQPLVAQPLPADSKQPKPTWPGMTGTKPDAKPDWPGMTTTEV